MRRYGIALVLVGVVAGCTSNTIDTTDTNSMDGAADSGTAGPSSTTAQTSSTPPNPTTAGPMPTTAPPPPMTTIEPDTGVTTVPTATGFDTGDTDSADTFETMDTGDTGPGMVSFFADVAPILQQVCAPSCHSPGGEWPVQDLQNSPYFALVNVPSQQAAMNKVEPGSLEDSYLWHKINGSHIDVGGAGLMMPKGILGDEPVELTDAQFDIIATWILDGAPNN